jgi:uncharacterized protein
MVAKGAIDCDVHVAPATMDDLFPYLDDYWREYVAAAEIRLLGNSTSYPPEAPTTATEEARAAGGPAVPSSYEALAERVLGPAQPRYAILNCLTLLEAYRNPYYQAALAGAINDWLRDHFLERDDRLRASLVVPMTDVEGAVAEIERLGSDRRFVQVLLPVRAEAPYGNKRFHPIHEAASNQGLAIALHAWGLPGHAPSPTGYTMTYLEDYLGNSQTVQTHVLSLVAEGVFERFPDLRVSLVECGFGWLPPLLWRSDKDWKGIWREVPWVKELPSAYVKRHFRATTQPTHGPQGPQEIRELLAMIGSDWLLYASDYPHDHGPSAEKLYEALDDAEREAVFRGNAAAFYRLNGGP